MFRHRSFVAVPIAGRANAPREPRSGGMPSLRADLHCRAGLRFFKPSYRLIPLTSNATAYLSQIAKPVSFFAVSRTNQNSSGFKPGNLQKLFQP